MTEELEWKRGQPRDQCQQEVIGTSEFEGLKEEVVLQNSGPDFTSQTPELQSAYKEGTEA
jgi:hypothetical protein